MPKKVDELAKRVKKDNPSYDESKAWATAWSIYCKHVSPGNDSCKKGPDGYLKGKKGRQDQMVRRLASRILASGV